MRFDFRAGAPEIIAAMAVRRTTLFDEKLILRL
jgi:hypothetical protein